MEKSLFASAAVGVSGLHVFRRASNPSLPLAFCSSRRYGYGSIRSGSERRNLSPVEAAKDFSEQDCVKKLDLQKFGRFAALFLGSSAFLLAAGLNSSGAAFAHQEAVATATVASESTETTKKIAEEGGSEEDAMMKKKKSSEEEREMLDCLTRLHEQMEKRNMPAAIKLLNKLIDNNPYQMEFRFIRGHAYEYIGDLDNALKEFEEVVKIQPLSVRGLQGLALVLKKQGKDIDFIQKIVEDAAAKAAEENRIAENITYRMLLGQILTLKEDLPLALQHYEQLSKEDPTDFRPHLCQGLVCCILGDLDKAEQHFGNFEKYCPKLYQGRDAMEDLIKKARTEATNKMRPQ